LPKKKSNQNTEFGERLKHLREVRSLKVAELAKRIHASPAAIWHWEHRGTRPRTGTLSAIAKALGVSRSFLETGKPVGGGIQNETGVQSDNDQMSLEQLMRAIEAKGFEVYVRSKGDVRS
jgi:transcriptional regulator with XRE-family HTH domain